MSVWNVVTLTSRQYSGSLNTERDVPYENAQTDDALESHELTRSPPPTVMEILGEGEAPPSPTTTQARDPPSHHMESPRRI